MDLRRASQLRDINSLNLSQGYELELPTVEVILNDFDPAAIAGIANTILGAALSS